MKLTEQYSNEAYLLPEWPGSGAARPRNVNAFTTLTAGGFSTGGYGDFNLATHVGDDLQAVAANRAKLATDLGLPAEPLWLEQVHSNKVIIADDKVIRAAPPGTGNTQEIQADASISRTRGVVCAVLTADCLPVFFCNRAGSEVAVAHAGWRGLHAGILSNTVTAMQSPAEQLLVSYGPAIGSRAFEVGKEVFAAFMDKNSKNQAAFIKTDTDHYLCDIYHLASIELQSIGVTQIAGGNYCTFHEHRFYSYRRVKNTGRMASIIWMS